MFQQLMKLCALDETAQTLTGIYCSAPDRQRELENWFASVDFDALPPEITCMAAGACVGFSGLPQTLTPRLRGLIKYVHTLNAGMISGLCALGTVLNRADIPVLLLEDTALYMSCSDTPQRQLWQMRLGVQRQDYSHALDAVREAGWNVEVFPYAAVARQGVTRQISITPLDGSSYLWHSPSELKKGNAVFLCPETAAILVGLCQSAFRGLTKPNPRATVIRWSMDMTHLLGRMTEADWGRAAQLAGKERARSHMYLLWTLFEALSGSSLPQKALFGTEQAAQHLLRLLIALRACPEKSHRARRVFLLCRLRRPDSILHATGHFLREVLRKLGI